MSPAKARGTMPSTTLITKVHSLLERSYGVKRARKARSNPLDELILTILSQNTSDINSRRAFQMLRQVMPTWEEVLRASVRKVAQSINSGGLANVKAERIKAVLWRIYREQGHFDLSFLRDLSVEEVKAYLSRFKGIGPKTVACVLLFSLGKPAFPVDTHVYRVATRLGLVDGRARPGRVQTLLESMVPSALHHSMHMNLVEHGRKTCKPRAPLCSVCPLSKLCAFVR
jgi:endonuclease-3